MHDGNKERLHLTDHAWRRYCQRVFTVERDTLQQELAKEAAGHYRHDRSLCKLAGVWWRCATSRGGMVTLITCYGSMPYDLIDAWRWCKRHKDRVRLSTGGEVTCDGVERKT